MPPPQDLWIGVSICLEIFFSQCYSLESHLHTKGIEQDSTRLKIQSSLDLSIEEKALDPHGNQRI